MLQFCLALSVAFVVFGSSIWVLIDAQRLGIKGGQGGLLSNSPVVWFIGCIALWIVAFPLYLVARSRAVATRRSAVPDVCLEDGAAFAPRPTASRGHRQAGAPAWVGPTSLAVGIASIPAAVVGILGAPLWLGGLGLGIWGAAAGGAGRRLAIGGIVASVAGFFAMIAAIVLMTVWMQSQKL